MKKKGSLIKKLLIGFGIFILIGIIVDSGDSGIESQESSESPATLLKEADEAYIKGDLKKAFELYDETLVAINEMDKEDELYNTYHNDGMSGYNNKPIYLEEFANIHSYLKEISTYKNGLLPSSLFLRRLGHAGPYGIRNGEYYESLKDYNNEWGNYKFRLHELRTAKKIANAYFKQGDYDKFLWILGTNDRYELRITGKEFYEYATVLSDKNKLPELRRFSNARSVFSGWCETIPTWGNDIIDSEPSELKYFRLNLDMLVFKYLAGDTQNSLNALEALYKEKKKESLAALKFVYLGYIAVAYSKCGQKEKSEEIFKRLENMAPFTAEQMTKEISEQGITDYFGYYRPTILKGTALESVYLHLTKMYAKAGYDKPLVRLQRTGIWVSGSLTPKYYDTKAVYPALIDLDQNQRMKTKNRVLLEGKINVWSGRDNQFSNMWLMPTDFVLDLAEIYHSQGKNKLALELLNNFMTATVSDTNAVLGVKIGGVKQGEGQNNQLYHEMHSNQSERLFRFVDLYLSLDGPKKAIQVTNQLLRMYNLYVYVDEYYRNRIRINYKRKNIKSALSNLSNINFTSSSGYEFPLPVPFTIVYAKLDTLEKSRFKDLNSGHLIDYRKRGHPMNGEFFTTINYLLKNKRFNVAQNLLDTPYLDLIPFDKVSGLVEIGKAYHQNKNFEMSKKYFDKAMLQAEFITPQPPSFLLAEIMVAYAKSGHIEELKKVYSAMPDYVYELRDIYGYNPDYFDIWENRKENILNDKDIIGLYKYEAILMSIPHLFKKDNPDKSWELFTEFSKMIEALPDDIEDTYFDDDDDIGGWKPILISDLVIEWYNVFGNDENEKIMPFIEQAIQDFIKKDPEPFYYSNSRYNKYSKGMSTWH